MKHILLITPFLPLIAQAQSWTLKNPTPGGGTTLQEFVLLLLDIVQLVTTPVLVVCLIYGGFLFVSAGGNEDQVSRSKQWMLWSLVGTTIIVGAKVIAQALFNTASVF
jgi:hypothetical protein